MNKYIEIGDSKEIYIFYKTSIFGTYIACVLLKVL
jgi:hypothetical protein